MIDDLTENITVKEIKELCEKIAQARDAEDTAEDVAKRLTKVRMELETRLITALEAEKMTAFPMEEIGKKFSVREVMQLAGPQGENKEMFFDYLKKIGQFDALASIHSRTLSSWYNQENEAAIARGEPCAIIPGLELPTKRKQVYVTKL